VLNLNFFSDVSLSCDYHYDYLDFLLMVTIVPAILTILLLIGYYCHRIFLIWKWKRDFVVIETQSADISRSNHVKLLSLYGSYLKVFLVCSFLSLPGISIFIFRTFSCIDIDPDNVGGRYLQADYSINCNSSRYEWGRSYAIGMVFVYPVGVTGYYAWLLFSHKDLIMNRQNQNLSESEKQMIEPLSFLFSAYEPRYWYWELIETVRRVVLTGVLVMFRQGTSLQIVVAILTSLAFMKLYGHFGI
jgi:hypothetical protein